ncbi:LysE/ArgO family amino acid transporter [Nocardioides caeni]|uniref:Amino acid transporter n=1 Tax=Nocardioides caeni TaxID=574700 RepID=A0A4S8MZD7_9ACTN|nr:LysE/ArgO family amino acid transporter [Nocardioides caeni]THV08847.1 amino acid transporter [Nocardioides caeni]
MIAPIGAGFVTGGSLIVAIGAQNAYVLRQGLTRQHTGAVVAVCAISDIVLIAAGVAGVGTLVERSGWLVEFVTWLGVCFLLAYAASAVRRALRPGSLTADGPVLAEEARGPVLARAAALTWLNPHVYLDTVLLIGSIAATHAATDGAVGGRWLFALGACAASVVWFASLGFGARRLSPLLSRPRSWQVLELVVAATMVLVAAKLALG